MRTIVITGSTRGIGYGLADAFLGRGCNVTVSGRTQQAVESAVTQLGENHPEDCIFGCPCDVTELNAAQIEADLRAVKAAGADGLSLSWDLWHMPPEWLELVRSVWLSLRPPFTDYSMSVS